MAPVVSLAIAVAFALLCAQSAFAETTFSITGHGFGHGIGMSQYGARGMADHGWSYSSILRHYYQGTTVGSLGYTAGSSSETIMRVAIQKIDAAQAYWTARANVGELWVSWDGMPANGYLKFPAGTSYTFFRSGGTIAVRDQNGVTQKSFTGADWVQVWERNTSEPRYAGLTQILQASGPFDWPNVLYRGSIVIEKQTSTTTGMYARNHVYMEDYVRCVVPRESPALWPVESLKAQAVAARSYAYVSRKDSSSYDVYCTTSSQVYNGWGTWVSGSGNVRHLGDSGVDPAVNATPAQVVKYGSTVVQTFFFSTSGGHTEDISNVWPSSAQQPYYTGVPDPYEHDAGSAYHSWGPFVYTASQVRTQLLSAGISASKVPVIITDVRVTKRGESGRVMELQLIGVGESYTLSGSTEMNRVRNALCKSRDTWFYVDAMSDRVEGDDRYETAVEMSRGSFSSASSVVIANGSSYADALTASGLAGALNAPVMLTKKDSLPAEVAAEIVRLGATKAYVVGGLAVVGDAAISQLRGVSGIGSNGVERISGVDRYETGLRIAEKIKALKGSGYSNTAIVVSGTNFADAVAAAPWAYRADTGIVLVRSDGAPAASKLAVQALGATSVQVVGGPAVVPDAVAASLGVTVKRVASGSDRYDTAAILASYLVQAAGFEWDTTHVASGISLVDALAGGAYAGRNGGPVIFATQYALPSPSTTALTSHRLLIDRVQILGGPGAINNVVEARIEECFE